LLRGAFAAYVVIRHAAGELLMILMLLLRCCYIFDAARQRADVSYAIRLLRRLMPPRYAMRGQFDILFCR